MIGTSNHPNIEKLRSIYADLRRIGEFSANDVVLHTAERGIPGRPAQVVGQKAVVAKELELIRATNDTLLMDVQSIVANDHFGAVLGILRARLNGREIGVPFCGLWRFRDGLITEHWENAYDVNAFARFLMGESA